MRGNVIQGMNILDVIYKVGKASKKSQAVQLNAFEEILGKESKEYQELRKVFLDNHNKYTRSIASIIFGNEFNL